MDMRIALLCLVDQPQSDEVSKITLKHRHIQQLLAMFSACFGVFI
jgi:hypothetical protein